MYSPTQKRAKKQLSPQKIKVVCRVRPFLAEELYDDTVVVEENSIKITNKRKTNENFVYSFYSCYDMNASQLEIFEHDVRPLLEPVLNGKNATIFAYGVTGSGKTYTMQGAETDPGIIPRTIQTLFQIKSEFKYSLELRLSYIELYKEVINDLLVSRETAPIGGLNIRQGSDNQIYLSNLTEKKIDTYGEFKKIFRCACRNRSTAATKLNIMSSRSHADMCIYISCTNNETRNTTFSKLHLIDLAGSEDNRRTENGKERIAESSAINKSLLALNQVVEALNQGLSRIPYRDSKLTRLLQDSLGGENISMMIINISPGQSFYADTTLKFASRTKEIENKPHLNHYTSSTRQPLKVKFEIPSRLANVNEYDDHLPEAKRQRFSDPTDKKKTNSVFERMDRYSYGVIPTATTTTFYPLSNYNNYSTPSTPPQMIPEMPDLSLSSSTTSYELPPPPLSETEMAKIIQEKIETKLDEKLSEIENKLKLQILSPIFRKQDAKLKKRIESLEYKMELQKESRLANVLTPETKTKTARALVALAKAHEQKNELREALHNYESAFQYIPDNQKLGNKIATIKDVISTGDVLKLKKRKRYDEVEQHQLQQKVSDDDEKATPSEAVPASSSSQPSINNSNVSAKDHHSRHLAAVVNDEKKKLTETMILNIVNSGDLREILKLKGVGKKRADVILQFINDNGPISEVKSLFH
ncbi:785_t:CDS:10 [Ambispora gerdemannii]|uniref:Kinesin-like protein n=1 Tax=Ambispora gerdemannii TaxID=144530 RepID=A0A9N8YSS7_9GLOM|nr:785_t:CDS:10 [Ambispora gerdemannii]